MFEKLVLASRLVAMSPQITVPPPLGGPFQSLTWTALMVEVVVDPVWYPKKVIWVRPQPGAGTVKSSATLLLLAIWWPKPSVVMLRLVTWSRLASAPPAPPPGCVIRGPLS